MDSELVRRKAAQAERALARVKARLPGKAVAFERDIDSQDIVYRNFQIAVQNCVDIGSHVIAEMRWEIPRSMGEVFERLAARRFIHSRLAREMRDMVVLRNIIVHDYTRIDLRKAHPLLQSCLKTIPRFCLAALAKAR